jgi:hypothetical protein
MEETTLKSSKVEAHHSKKMLQAMFEVVKGRYSHSAIDA